MIPVTVTVDGGYNLAGCKLKLRFDEGFLQYVRADFGSFGGVTEAGVSPDNSVTLSFVSMEAVATTQTFCTVWFRIVDGAVGTTKIEPIVSEAIDVNNQTISGLSADSVSITVTAQSLTMTSQPTKKYYFCGEPLDTTGMTLVATFPNGSTKELADFGLFGFDTNSSGNQTVTVRSGKHTASFEVVVARKGDVNCDDLVNLADYAIIVDTAVFAENQPEGELLFRQDLMQDGAVDCFDAAYESLLISGIVQ
ncbi:MAG TPA: bacterial Ig-like domain-containing protein [Candidatus Fimenecus excrementavium]|nr:bacterial Ig-like domain-containing protein [Candidatus Fimenecus excrementavium]